MGEQTDGVNLLFLCAGNPRLDRTFSGSAKGLLTALEQCGVVHHAASVLGATDPFQRGSLPVRMLRRLDRFGLEGAYRWSPWSWRRNTRRAQAIAANHPGFNACFMYGTSYRPLLGVPTYCYFDATSAQVLKWDAWEFRNFSRRKAARIVAFQRSVFEHCTAIFPRSAWAARSVIEDYGIPPEKVVVAGAGPNYLPDPPAHAPYDRQTILFVGTEFERKGGPLLLEAFRRVRKQLPEARLVIAGCSPAVDEPGVTVEGRIPRDAPGGLDRLLALYAEASVFCIMSTFEPFGIVVLEAQNSYVPCVAPAAFAFTETVVDGETGRHVADPTPEPLAAVLSDLLSSPDRLAAMGRAAHEHVRNHWTWDVAARRIIERIASDLAPSLKGVS